MLSRYLSVDEDHTCRAEIRSSFRATPCSSYKISRRLLKNGYADVHEVVERRIVEMRVARRI